MIPSTLEECFAEIDRMLSHEAKLDILASDDEKIMSGLHHSLGQYMRNKWGLWKGDTELHAYFKGLGIWHADDMSGIILKSYFRYTHDKPLDIDGQVKHYLAFWKKNGGQPDELGKASN